MKFGRTNSGIFVPGSPTLPRRQQKAVMKSRVTEGGSVLVQCPYCLIDAKQKNRTITEDDFLVDVTKFVDRGGAEITFRPQCGHTLRFKSIDEWRSVRQAAGVQRR